MLKKYFLYFVTFFVLCACLVFATNKLIPTSEPASTFYSLDDIYNLITTGVEKGSPNSPISTTTEPTATTSHSIAEIYALLTNQLRENFSSTTAIFAIVGDLNIPDSGHVLVDATYSTLTAQNDISNTGYTLNNLCDLINNHSTSSSSHSIATSSAPENSMCTTNVIYDYLDDVKDSLSAGNIRNGYSIFGITGTLKGAVNTLCPSDIGSHCEPEYCGVDSSDWVTFRCTIGAENYGCNSDSDCATTTCQLYEGHNVCRP
jgi:hypothetical protein